MAGRTRYALITVVVVVAVASASIPLLTGSHHARTTRHLSALVVRSPRATAANWQAIQEAASLRQNALAPSRTAFHRAFAAYMGLSQLLKLHPIRPGRCAIAVSYLYDNLLDLRQAYTGEDFTPLRQAVATEPSLEVCAPRARLHVRYVE